MLISDWSSDVCSSDLVGFTLSPVLWRKLPGAKSAGRVQSVALRLIVEREREIEGFKPQEYWSITAHLEADGQGFDARLVRWNGDKIDRLTIGAEGQAMAAKKAVEDGNFTVESVETKPARSEERRVGKKGVRTFSTRGGRLTEKK